MKIEEVLPALRKGKNIQWTPDDGSGPLMVGSFAAFLWQIDPIMLQGDKWSVVVLPASDEELAAAFDRKAAEYFGIPGYAQLVDHLSEAAQAVRTRKVPENW